jgi:hypothetical protein
MNHKASDAEDGIHRTLTVAFQTVGIGNAESSLREWERRWMRAISREAMTHLVRWSPESYYDRITIASGPIVSLKAIMVEAVHVKVLPEGTVLGNLAARGGTRFLDLEELKLAQRAG